MSTEAPRRTTGRRSQNARLHGGCEDIAEQLSVVSEVPTPKALVYLVLCLEAVAEHIIPDRIVMGLSVPEHESRWTTKQCADVIELLYKRVSMLVAKYGVPFYLHEYSEDGKRTEKVLIKP